MHCFVQKSLSMQVWNHNKLEYHAPCSNICKIKEDGESVHLYRLPTSVTNATIAAATRTNTGSLSMTDTDVLEHIRKTLQNVKL